MSIDDLRAFVALVPHGSLSRAAAHLHLTQPAMTRRIQRLERAIGGALLDRSVKPARPSSLGMHLYERAKVVLQEFDGLRELLNEDGEPEGVLRLGSVQSISETTAISIITQLKRRYPKLQIEMQSDWSMDLIRKMRLGQLDAAAIMSPQTAQLPEDIIGELIGVHRTAIVASKAFLSRRVGSLRQLGGYPWVLYPSGCILRAALLREFQARGLELNVAVSANSLDHQLALVSAGAGLGFVSEIMTKNSRYREKLQVVRVNDFAFNFGIRVVRQPFLGNLTMPVRVFREVVKSRFGNKKGGQENQI